MKFKQKFVLNTMLMAVKKVINTLDIITEIFGSEGVIFA